MGVNLLSAGGKLVSGPMKAQTFALHEIVAWDYSWDVNNAVIYNDAGTTRVDYIPDRSGTFPLIRDQGWYGPAYGQPVNKGPLYISASPRFKNHSAMISQAGPNGGSPMLSTTRDPTLVSTWFGGTSAGRLQPYWCVCCIRPFEDPSGSAAAWDAMQGNIGTTVSLFTGLSGLNWGCTTGVRSGGLDPWPDSGIVQDENATVLVIVNVNGTSSWFELNFILPSGIISTIRDTSFTLSLDAPARELFYGWHGRAGYWSFGAFKFGNVTEPEVDAVRRFAMKRIPSQTTGTPLGAEP